MQWVVFEEFDERTSAESVAARLESGDVPVVIRSKPVAAVERGFRVMVPDELLHRARWLAAQFRFSDDELTCLATGELSGQDEDNDADGNDGEDS